MSSGAPRSMRGMILAAGYGTRLAPITDHAPKPLLPVGGRPLIDRIIASFDRAGVRELAVNTHHLGDQIIEYLAGRPDADRFTLFPESEILGTGGALDGARSFLSESETFLLHNGDVLCDVDLGALAEDHRNSGATATLLLVDWPQVNSVEMAADGAIVSIAGRPARQGESPVRSLTYAGVGAFSSKLLADIEPGFSSLIDPVVRAMEADPGCVRGFFRPEFQWDDLGTLPRLLRAQQDGPATESATGPVDLERITGHGSDRRFWRIRAGRWSAVAMHCPTEDPEFVRQVAIGKFLERHDLGAPNILSVHEQERVLLSEDLGSERLYEIATHSAQDAVVVSEHALDLLVRLQETTGQAKTECPLAVDRCLDHATLRWETDYFGERFLEGHLGLDAATTRKLNDDFETLATLVAAQPLVLIHRDFQSQNIHLTDETIRLVDYQGMRLGPQGYDAASVIFDPYVDLGKDERERLLAGFARAAASSGDLTPVAVRAMVLAAALQRLMQALGAFGFLGHIKGKSEFLGYIPAAVERLREVWECIESSDPSHPLAGSIPDLSGLFMSDYEA